MGLHKYSTGDVMIITSDTNSHNIPIGSEVTIQNLEDVFLEFSNLYQCLYEKGDRFILRYVSEPSLKPVRNKVFLDDSLFQI